MVLDRLRASTHVHRGAAAVAKAMRAWVRSPNAQVGSSFLDSSTGRCHVFGSKRPEGPLSPE